MMALKHIRENDGGVPSSGQHNLGDTSEQIFNESRSISAMDDKMMEQLPLMESSLSPQSIQRKPSVGEDPATMTIDFLRARLLSERSVSKAAWQEANQLAKKVLELERQLESEIQQRNRAETARLEALARLNEELRTESIDLAGPNTGEAESYKSSEGQTGNESGESIFRSPNEEIDGHLQTERVNIECFLRSSLFQDQDSVTERVNIDNQSRFTLHLNSEEDRAEDSIDGDEEGSQTESSLENNRRLPWETRMDLIKRQNKQQRHHSHGSTERVHRATPLKSFGTPAAHGEPGYRRRMGKSVRQREIRRTLKVEIKDGFDSTREEGESARQADILMLQQNGCVDQKVNIVENNPNQYSLKSRQIQSQTSVSANAIDGSMQEYSSDNGLMRGKEDELAFCKDGVVMEPPHQHKNWELDDVKKDNMDNILACQTEHTEKYEAEEKAQKIWEEKFREQDPSIDCDFSQVTILHRMEEGPGYTMHGHDGLSGRHLYHLMEGSANTVEFNNCGSSQALDGKSRQHSLHVSSPVLLTESESHGCANVSVCFPTEGHQINVLDVRESRDLAESQCLVMNPSEGESVVKDIQKITTFMSCTSIHKASQDGDDYWVAHGNGIPKVEHKIVENGKDREDGFVSTPHELQSDHQTFKAMPSEKELQMKAMPIQVSDPFTVDMCSKQRAMPDEDVDLLTEQPCDQRTECDGMAPRDHPAGLTGQYDRRLSSSFKFDVYNDFSKAEVDVFKKEDALVDDSQVCKVVGTSCLLLDMFTTSNSLKQRGWAETDAVSPARQTDLSSSNGFVDCVGTDTPIEKLQQSLLLEGGVAVSKDRQAGSVPCKSSHETLPVNYKNEQFAADRCFLQEQLGITQSILCGNKPKQAVVTGIQDKDWHGKTVPFKHSDCRLGMESSSKLFEGFFDTNQHSFSRNTSEDALNSASEILGRNMIKERVFGMNQTTCTDIVNDSPWIEAFRRRIRAGNVLDHLHYSTHHEAGVQVGHSPYASTYLDRGMPHISNPVSRSSAPASVSCCQSSISRHSRQDASTVGHGMPLDSGNFDRVNEILKALEVAKQYVQRSTLKTTFPNHSIGCQTRGGQLMLQPGSSLDYHPAYIPGSLYYSAEAEPSFNPYFRGPASPLSEPPSTYVRNSLGPSARIPNDTDMQYLARDLHFATKSHWNTADSHEIYQAKFQDTRDKGGW